MSTNLISITESTRQYNFHAHTQFCDGRDSMDDIAAGAEACGMEWFAFTPHSPVPIESPCNMAERDVKEYFSVFDRLRDKYAGRMELLRSFEIDYLGADWGPHIDYFQRQPLDFRLGSVHFVPNQEGVLLDCDGRFERFSGYLKDGYGGDLRYVVETYFEQVLRMLERGGFDLLGHFDKIAGNASQADPELESRGWYEAYVDDVVSHVSGSGMTVEINTKAFADKGRFYPAERWWGKLLDAGVPLAVDSDAHYAGKVSASREEAFRRLDALRSRRDHPGA